MTNARHIKCERCGWPMGELHNGRLIVNGCRVIAMPDGLIILCGRPVFCDGQRAWVADRGTIDQNGERPAS